jgi:CheY-like chemotaxis protein
MVNAKPQPINKHNLSSKYIKLNPIDQNNKLAFALPMFREYNPNSFFLIPVIRMQMQHPNYYCHIITRRNKWLEKESLLDDSSNTTSRLKTALENQGDESGKRRYKVDTYKDPILALQNFRAGLYCLLPIDFMMAKTSNHKLCNKVRQMDNKVKICYTSETYQNYEEARKVFLDLEITCFIPKQAQMQDLVRRISEVLMQ